MRLVSRRSNRLERDSLAPKRKPAGFVPDRFGCIGNAIDARGIDRLFDGCEWAVHARVVDD